MSFLKASLSICFCVMAMAQNAIAQKPAAPPEMKLAALPLSAIDPADSLSTPEKVALGRLLFFDPILSATKKVACSTCHNPEYGWADGRATPLGVGGQGTGPNRLPVELTGIEPLSRNTPGLLNVGFNGLVSGQPYDPVAAPMFFDGREESLEAQVFHPIRTRAEMLGNEYPESEAVAKMVERVVQVSEYRRRFAEVYSNQNSPEISSVKIAEVIAAFERSLVSADTPFDRFMRGEKSAMTVQQQRGMKTFEKAGCVHCHGGPMFSDFKLHSIGVLGIGGDDREPM